MNDRKPYLVRAIYDWIVDNQCTPYMVVQADIAGVQVPEAYVNDGKITLNIAEQSVQSLNLGNDDVIFSATFGGQLEHVRVPCNAIAAIFARENGQGMAFDVSPQGGPQPPKGPDEPPTEDSGGDKDAEKDKAGSERPKLKVVK